MRAVLSTDDVPETQPATELLRGELVQKMSPGLLHQRVARRLSVLLEQWEDEIGSGDAVPELDVDVRVGDEPAERFVPDAVYVAGSESTRWSKRGSLLTPLTVAFEIASPDDAWRPRTDYKLKRYLAAGAAAVVVIDPVARTIDVHTPKAVTTLAGNDEFSIDAMPGFRFTLDRLFSVLDRG